MSRGSRVRSLLTIQTYLFHGHGHIVPISVEDPVNTGRSSNQTDLQLPPAVHLVYHIQYRAELNTVAVEDQAGRPFLLAHGLVQQDQSLEYGRFAGRVSPGEQREWRKRQVQSLETLEEPQSKVVKHRRPPRGFAP